MSSSRMKQFQKDWNKDFSRHFCKYCKKYIDNRPLAIRHHENGSKHKFAVEEFRRQRVQDRRDSERQQREENDQWREIEVAARASYQKDMEERDLPPPVRSEAPRRPPRPAHMRFGPPADDAQETHLEFPLDTADGEPRLDDEQQPLEATAAAEEAAEPAVRAEAEVPEEDGLPSPEELETQLQSTRQGFLQLRTSFGEAPTPAQSEVLDKLQGELIELQFALDRARERVERRARRLASRAASPSSEGMPELETMAGAGADDQEPEAPPEPQIDPATGMGMWEEVRPEDSVFSRDSVAPKPVDRLTGQKRGGGGAGSLRRLDGGPAAKKHRSEAQALADVMQSSEDDESYLATADQVAPPPAGFDDPDEPVVAFKRKKKKNKTGAAAAARVR